MNRGRSRGFSLTKGIEDGLTLNVVRHNCRTLLHYTRNFLIATWLMLQPFVIYCVLGRRTPSAWVAIIPNDTPAGVADHKRGPLVEVQWISPC